MTEYLRSVQALNDNQKVIKLGFPIKIEEDDTIEVVLVVSEGYTN